MLGLLVVALLGANFHTASRRMTHDNCTWATEQFCLSNTYYPEISSVLVQLLVLCLNSHPRIPAALVRNLRVRVLKLLRRSMQHCPEAGMNILVKYVVAPSRIIMPRRVTMTQSNSHSLLAPFSGFWIHRLPTTLLKWPLLSCPTSSPPSVFLPTSRISSFISTSSCPRSRHYTASWSMASVWV